MNNHAAPGLDLTTVPGKGPLPDTLFGGSEPADEESLWRRFYPRDVPFFKVALLDQLYRRPYHAVTLHGPFDIQQLAQDHSACLFRSETSLSRSGGSSIDRLLLCLENGVFGFLEGDSLIIYAPTTPTAATVADQFRRYVKPPPATQPHFNLITVGPEGPCTESVVLERAAPVATEELALNYGEDFPLWEERWMEWLRRTPSGLTILFGPPGCGKTSYLRALMTRLIERAIFYYVPVSEAAMLVNPSFVSFWINQTYRHQGKQKLAILEDAEELLLTRDGASRDKVSNLLNIADGFLGDYLKLQVIATTNVPFGQLDPAIVRPGRLMGVREFRRLNRVEAARLANAKGLALAPAQTDYSLAELYCAQNEADQLTQRRQFGFA